MPGGPDAFAEFFMSVKRAVAYRREYRMGKSAVQKKKKFSYADVLKNIFPWKGDPVREKIRKIIFLIAITVFGISAFQIFNIKYEDFKNNSMYHEIQKDVPVLSELIKDETETTYEDEEMLDYMKTLVEMNEDIVGYIQIPDKNGSCRDSGVDYPIVQRRDEGEKDYYLEHNFRGEPARAGTLYLDYRNVLNAKERSGNLIIYGHEMSDGSMFGKLKNYYTDTYFYEEHPLVILSSRYEVSTYKIFGYYYADGGAGDCEFYYTDKTDFWSEEEFYDYVNQIKRRSLSENMVDVKYGDQLITLSTCITGAWNDARFVVAARRVRSGEDDYAGTQENHSKPESRILMPLEWYKERGIEKNYDDTDFVPYG